MNIDTVIDKGLLPDWALRLGIRRQLRERLQTEPGGPETLRAYADALREGPIAVKTAAANAQHYEVPSAFFEAVLGPYLKYSSCLWPEGVETLAEAEAAMLELTARRAGIEDGMRVLDLGCGWGSMTRWIARHHSRCQVVAVSNSRTQKAFIEARAAREGLTNVEVRTADVATFEPEQTFDRIVSVEMFEHMTNYEALLRRVAGWLAPEGRLFVHVFVHRDRAYRFEDEAGGSWMGRHFFSGGQMPADDLLLEFQDDLALEARWRVDGRHYARTARAWLERLDAGYDLLEAMFDEAAPHVGGRAIVNRWRVFFMACEELWDYRGGAEWYVSHYLFGPRR